MQKEGFPVDYYFIIHNMRPYSTEIETQALALEKMKYIKIETHVPLRYPEFRERYDYILTEEGRKYLEEKVIPILKNLANYKFLRLIGENKGDVQEC